MATITTRARYSFTFFLIQGIQIGNIVNHFKDGNWKRPGSWLKLATTVAELTPKGKFLKLAKYAKHAQKGIKLARKTHKAYKGFKKAKKAYKKVKAVKTATKKVKSARKALKSAKNAQKKYKKLSKNARKIGKQVFFTCAIVLTFQFLVQEGSQEFEEMQQEYQKDEESCQGTC